MQISDDDRMSLTTAISDEDEIGPGSSGQQGQAAAAELQHGGGGSPYKQKPGGQLMSAGASSSSASGSAASFNCTGAVRKAGFLSVKKWLLRKKHQVWQLYFIRVDTF